MREHSVHLRLSARRRSRRTTIGRAGDASRSHKIVCDASRKERNEPPQRGTRALNTALRMPQIRSLVLCCAQLQADAVRLDTARLQCAARKEQRRAPRNAPPPRHKLLQPHGC
eukprot:5052946-Pleurochrysis_carterae.AAC.3